MAKNIRKIVAQWYQGKHHENKPEDPFFIVGHYHRHWTSQVAHKIVSYWKKEYRWIIGIGLSLIGLSITIISRM